MSALTTAALRDGLTRIVRKLEDSEEELNSLDAVLGDGDLGVSLTRGGRSLLVELPNLPDDDIGTALGKCAQAITRISGSTCGTLFATGLLSVSKANKGRREIPWSEMSLILATAIEGMSRRGNCRLGDKTVLDAIEAARSATEGIQDPQVLVASADKAVADAVEHYKHQPSRQGRARVAGDRSFGNADPGMVAFQRIIESLK